MGPHAGIEFAIIQVGPHARQAFRLAQDFIDWQERYCFRRNEVWIRRGATSDLASPEEIMRLVKGQPVPGAVASSENIVYAHLPITNQEDALRCDLRKVMEERGGRVEGNRIIFRVGGLHYVWRYVILDNALRGSLGRIVQWRLNHGLLLLVRGTTTEQALGSNQSREIHFKTNWGWFTAFKSHSLYIAVSGMWGVDISAL